LVSVECLVRVLALTKRNVGSGNEIAVTTLMEKALVDLNKRMTRMNHFQAEDQ